MENIKKLNVLYNHRKVGTLALFDKFIVAFEYDENWLYDGFSISPFSLPLEKKVFIPKAEPFGGVFGVFYDSLPDGWGRLLVDRYLIKKHIDPRTINQLTRLTLVGNTGMGALTYEPNYDIDTVGYKIDLDEVAKECAKVLKTDYCDDLDTLFELGGSSGGARPKILTEVSGEEWIIKFPSSEDRENIGIQEYEYSLCARECGIEMEETRLFSSKICDGYFGTKRFDRNEFGYKVHMISVSGLLEISHRVPNLDYDVLMKLTLELTKDFAEVEKMFRLMCFNIFAHNRDDHSKNFSYLYLEDEDRFVLSPAYDLTYSNSLGGEHATTVHGNGINPGIDDILEVAKTIGIRQNKAKQIATDVKDCVYERLEKYL